MKVIPWFGVFPCLLLAEGVHGQCLSTVNTFPYQEGFEAAAAWNAGGVLNDWAWGTPAHPTINSAGGGSKSWCVGGLTGAFYGFGEQSWLESPCFDFSTLQYPMVSFKIFWECERTYDGMGFQYSLDQGTTWSNVGSVADQPDCNTQNWFNTSYINNMSLANPRQGWSGRVGPTAGSCAGGAGSNGWVTAKHCLVDLAGEPSVKFRFVFGAGTACNNYDGIAIDDIFIGETPPELPSFQSECFDDEISVHDIVSCADAWTWDFGDPASGPQNTSTLPAVTHAFSAPGNYTITLTLTYTCRAPVQLQLPLTILDLQLNAVDPTCAGSDGSASAVVVGATAPVNYTWTPGGASTSAINGLGAGTYTVNIVDAGICPIAGSIVLAPPPSAPAANISSTAVTCNGDSDGSANVVVNGGTPGYQYNWSPQGGSAATASNLPAGNYTCTITDAQSCAVTVQTTVTGPAALVLTAQNDTTVCVGESVSLQASAAGGTGAYAFVWAPQGPDVTPPSTTTYTVSVTDANGCTTVDEQVQVAVGSVATPQFTLSDSLGCTPHCVTFTTTDGANGEVNWDFGDGGSGTDAPDATHCFAQAGTFDVTITVTSTAGCSGTWTWIDAVDVLATPVAAFYASPPVATIDEPTIDLINRSTGSDSWRWTFGDPMDSSSMESAPQFTYGEVGCYTVQLVAMNALGCADSTSYLLCIEDEFAVFVPNAFTPNNDGFNDVWGAITTVGAPKEFELDVFDRWGRVLFHGTDKNIPWDGADQPIGVYPWRLRMIDSEGWVRERTGHVTLVR
ncbi:MAG: PKD domain-containing protein [Flavobacteriales bacterium]|nr:PKD domain-containing protein [Flavobacteriales bacterium]